MSGPVDSVDSSRGWLLVLISFFTLFCTWGIVYTYTVYAGALASELGLGSLQTSSVFSIMTMAFYIAGAVIGLLASGLPLRLIIGGAAGITALGTGSIQFVNSFLGVAIAFSMIGIASGAAFVVVVSTIPQWFDEYQGRAMGITMVGSGLGVQVLPFGWLRLLEMGDIRSAFLVVGGVTTLVLIGAMIVLRRPTLGEQAASDSIDSEWIRELLRDTSFWITFVGFAMMTGWFFVLSSGLVDILVAAGTKRSLAATAFGTIGGVSILSRLGSGVVADRLGARKTVIGAALLAVTGVVVLLADVTLVTIYISLTLFGVALGAIAPLYPPVLIHRFGPENATAIIGVFQLSSALAGFVAPVGIDILRSIAGGYITPLFVLAVVTLLGTGIFWVGTAPSAQTSATIDTQTS